MLSDQDRYTIAIDLLTSRKYISITQEPSKCVANTQDIIAKFCTRDSYAIGSY